MCKIFLKSFVSVVALASLIGTSPSSFAMIPDDEKDQSSHVQSKKEKSLNELFEIGDYLDAGKLESAFHILSPNHSTNINAWSYFLDPNYAGELPKHTVKESAKLFLRNFPDLEKEWSYCTLLGRLMNVYVREGKFKKAESLLSKYSEDKAFHSSLLGEGAWAYFQHGRTQRAFELLDQIKDWPAWKTVTKRFIRKFTDKTKKFDEKIFDEKNIEIVNSLFIKNVPEKEQGRVPYKLTQLLMALYAQKGNLQGIDEIMQTHKWESVQARLGYLNTCSKYLKENLKGRQYIIEKLHSLVSETEESPVQFLAVRAYVKNILKTPYDKDLYTKGEHYLDTLLNQISEMNPLNFAPYNKIDAEAEPSDSEFSIHTSCSGSDDENSSDESSKEEVSALKHRIKYNKTNLLSLKGCFALYRDERESMHIFGNLPEFDLEKLPPLFKTLKQIGFPRLREETKEAIRNLILKAYDPSRGYSTCISDRYPLLYAQALADIFEGTEGELYKKYKEIIATLRLEEKTLSLEKEIKKVGKEEEEIETSKN